MCKECNKLFIWKIKSNSLLRQKAWFKKWVIGKVSLKDISVQSGKSISTLQRLFKIFLNNSPTPKIRLNNNCHLIIDGTYHSNFCILNYLDNDQKYLQLYNVVDHENYDNYLDDLKLLKRSNLNIVSITSDGQRGLKKAISEIFPDIIHQRCIIHVQRMSLIYLTRYPKTEAGQMLRYWVTKLHKIDTVEKKNSWIYQFNNWCRLYDSFLKEKSESLSGRTWYTHKMLRRTRALIKNALPDMFHYLEYHEIPKSTNGLESRFSYLKNNINIHRGLSEKNRISFVKWYSYFKYQD